MRNLLLTACLLLAAFHQGCGNDRTLASGTESPQDSTDKGSCSRFKKGVNFTCWYPGCFEDEETDASLEALKEIGVNWLAIVHTWYQDTPSSTKIYAHPSKSPTDSDLRYLIPLAKEKGFGILLKPHVDITDGTWRGYIMPTDLGLWQESYRAFLLHMASLCQELGCNAITIGNELKTRSGDVIFWKELISDIRAIFGGELTYAANWDEFDIVGFWDDLDAIGIDFYYPLTDRPDASQAEMEAALADIGGDILTFSEAQGKPVLFTEIGYLSTDGTTMHPYYSTGGPVDEGEQADAYAAVLTAYRNAAWLDGIFWWRWDPQLSYQDPEGYIIHNKEAEEVLATFWQEELCN